MDCMKGLIHIPDKFFQLSICDPPYGIDIMASGRLVREKGLSYSDWDVTIPSKEYFEELMRVSDNQVIWGGNYFPLPPTKCYLIWDKQQPESISYASAELAWTSFSSVTKTWYRRPQGEQRIHPVQKPVDLYKWILHHYAATGNKNLDTHMGSQSCRIAAYLMDFDFWGWEIDNGYFERGNKRFKEAAMQLRFIMPNS